MAERKSEPSNQVLIHALPLGFKGLLGCLVRHVGLWPVACSRARGGVGGRARGRTMACAAIAAVAHLPEARSCIFQTARLGVECVICIRVGFGTLPRRGERQGPRERRAEPAAAVSRSLRAPGNDGGSAFDARKKTRCFGIRGFANA